MDAIAAYRSALELDDGYAEIHNNLGNALQALGRLAASLLENAGLGRLVTRSPAQYEALAFELAHDRARLEAIRDELRSGRDALPLFDSTDTTRALERAYLRMWRQYEEGDAPQGFDVRRD